MAKADWVTLDNNIVQGLYEFKDDDSEGFVQSYFPTLIVIEVTGLDPLPGPKWTYDGMFFSPPDPVLSPFNPIQAAKDLAATIDFTKLDDDAGKALTSIMYMLNILQEEV